MWQWSDSGKKIHFWLLYAAPNNQAETNTKTHPLTHTAEERDCLYKYNHEPEIMDGLEHLAEEEIEEEGETSRV